MKRRVGLILFVYLLGIFMGAIDTGIVTPARTIIQNDLGVDEKAGIWLITIYTLAFAASIPVLGKLADRLGRKPIYLTSIALFAVGSLMCGLAHDLRSFSFLIVARAIQALGGGGIIPIATAEFGTSVPEERRGLALGLVGGVYGIANIFGSSAGSLILDAFGKANWEYIFYVNLPISAVIIVLGMVGLPNNKAESTAPIDLLGNTLLVAMILSLLYGLRNVDFFALGTSLTSVDVWPYLLGFAFLLPFFLWAERRATDPVINLSYFTSRPTLVTLFTSVAAGVILIGTVFVPQFSENALGIASGSGGYFVIILGLTSGIGAPASGQLTDTFGPKVVLSVGLAISALAALLVLLWAIPQPSTISVVTCLALLGLGLGFTIGTPLNYMMLANTKRSDANSALATLSLVRSLGTTIAPAIMVGFLANAGLGLQPSLTALLPTEIAIPKLPYADELTTALNDLKSNPELADKLAGVTFPDLNRTSVSVNVNAGGTSSLPDELLAELKTADVTTITDRTKHIASVMFDDKVPGIIADITSGVNKGLDSLSSGIDEISTAVSTLSDGIAGVDSGIAGLQQAVAGMNDGIAGLTRAIEGQQTGLTQLRGIAAMIAAMPALPPGTPLPPLASLIPESIRSTLPQSVLDDLATITTPEELSDRIAALEQAIGRLTAQRTALIAQRDQAADKLNNLTSTRAEMGAALATLQKTRTTLETTRGQLITLRDAVPGAFAQAKVNYLAAIEARRPQFESTFRTTLNSGFAGIYQTTAATCLIALLVLAAYPRRRTAEPAPVTPSVPAVA